MMKQRILKKNRRVSFNRKGVFLIEALIATVILAVGLTAIIKSFSMGLEARKRGQEYFQASTLLENTLSALVANRYFDESLVGEGEFDEPFSGYHYRIDAENLDGSSVLKKVSVVIFWDRRDRRQSLEAATYLLIMPEEDGGV